MGLLLLKEEENFVLLPKLEMTAPLRELLPESKSKTDLIGDVVHVNEPPVCVACFPAANNG